jgi:hypothetical protein
MGVAGARWVTKSAVKVGVIAGAIAFAVAVVACGGSSSASRTSVGGANTAGGTTTDFATVRFCQKLDNGRWATNDLAGTEAPCTPKAGSPDAGPGDIEPNCKYYPPCPAVTATAGNSVHRAAPSPTPSTQQAAPAQTAPSPRLSGLGARQADFNANHTPQSAALNSAGVNGVDTVNAGSGRVIGFVLEFNAKPPLSIAEAESEARAELPPDAHLVVARRRDPTCAQEFYRSAALKHATGAGVALIDFESGQPGDPYDPSAVASATFTNLPTVDRSIPC